MPPQNGSQGSVVNTQILTTLKRMDEHIERATKANSPSSGQIFGASAAANFATSYLGRASGAAPNVSGTLTGNMDLLFGTIGSDPAMITQVVNLSAKVNDLRNAWAGMSQESRSMTINSMAAMAGSAAVVSVLSRAGPMITNAVSSYKDWGAIGNARLSQAMGWGASYVAPQGAQGPLAQAAQAAQGVIPQTQQVVPQNASGGMVGRSRLNIAGMVQGQAVAGAGMAMNATFGESYLGDAMVMGGVAQTAHYGHRYLSSRAFMRGFSPGMKLAGRAAGYAAIGAEIYASLPRGQGDQEDFATTTARTGNTRTHEVQQSLGHANEYPGLLNAGTGFANAGMQRTYRAFWNGGFQGVWQQREAMVRAGIMPSLTDLWKGGITGLPGNLYKAAEATFGNLSQEQMQDLAQETTNPGSTQRLSPDQRNLRRLTGALNFQSRQFDVGDLHGIIQQEAVRPEMEQENFRNLTNAIQILTAKISEANGDGPRAVPAPT